MNETPKGNRLHIALLGRTNVGKSSFLNLMAAQDIAITSPKAGTTTDVVEKAMELLPVGPVLLLDTAGIDDISSLSKLRKQKTEKVFGRADVILLVTEPDIWTEYEERVLAEARSRKILLIVAVNKIDLKEPSPEFMKMVQNRAGRIITVSSVDRGNRDHYVIQLKKHLMEVSADSPIPPPPIIGDLLPPNEMALLVVPIDTEAPKGRLILPQVQTIRDILDNNSCVVVAKEGELVFALNRMKKPPSIVVCDSQVVHQMCADTPPEVSATTFSILFARHKGDLVEAAKGVLAIKRLRPGDRVLIAEACSHHPLQDDIGRVKIPHWLKEYLGFRPIIDVCAGREYPADLAGYRLIIHCGGCMLNRREMLNRIQQAREVGVAVTNYGIAISFLQGVLRRVLSPFPSALSAFDKELHKIEEEYTDEQSVSPDPAGKGLGQKCHQG